jgi:hypothetical protein
MLLSKHWPLEQAASVLVAAYEPVWVIVGVVQEVAAPSQRLLQQPSYGALAGLLASKGPSRPLPPPHRACYRACVRLLCRSSSVCFWGLQPSVARPTQVQNLQASCWTHAAAVCSTGTGSCAAAALNCDPLIL